MVCSLCCLSLARRAELSPFLCRWEEGWVPFLSLSSAAAAAAVEEVDCFLRAKGFSGASVFSTNSDWPLAMA